MATGTTDLASHLHRLPQPRCAAADQGGQLAAGVPSQRAQLPAMPCMQQTGQPNCVRPSSCVEYVRYWQGCLFQQK